MKVQLNDIRHPDTWTGKEPVNHSPAFDYCRKLIAEGADPEERLDIYRGEKHSYSIRSIGEGAKLKILENAAKGPMVIKYKPVDEKAAARFALIKAKTVGGIDHGEV